jgi:hypothetical protein
MGKWISTTCCACLARSAVLKSKGFTITIPFLNLFAVARVQSNLNSGRRLKKPSPPREKERKKHGGEARTRYGK